MNWQPDVYQTAEITAARDRADVDLDANLRMLDMDEAEIGFLAERLGRSELDITDAITRLDTDRLQIQTQIANAARELQGLGLTRDDMAIRLQDLGYDREDTDIALRALDIKESMIGQEGVGPTSFTPGQAATGEFARVGIEDILNELAIERALNANLGQLSGMEQA